MNRNRVIAAAALGGLLAVGLLVVVLDGEDRPAERTRSDGKDGRGEVRTVRTGSGASGDGGDVEIDLDAEPGTPGSPFSPAPTWRRPRPPLPEPPPFGGEVLAEHASREPAKWRALSKVLRAEGHTALSERSRLMAARVQESAELEKEPRDAMLYDEAQIIVDIRATHPPDAVLEQVTRIENAVHALMQGGAHPDTIDPRTGAPLGQQ